MLIQRTRDLREGSDRTQQKISDYLNMHRSVYRHYKTGESEAELFILDGFNPTIP